MRAQEEDSVSPIEVFIGGLPASIDEETLSSAFEAVGGTHDVQIRRSRGRGSSRVPCGFAWVYFKDYATAEAAIQQVKQIQDRPVAVHLSRSRLPDNIDKLDDVPALHIPSDESHTLAQLLPALRAQPYKQSAVSLALKQIQEAKEAAAPTGVVPAASTDQATSNDTTEVSSRGTTPIMDSSKYLESFPLCNQLIQRFAELKTPKTPMSILHEYATRSAMQLTYDETAEGPLGPFIMEAKLVDPDSNTEHSGVGRGKTKKDAKHFAAATVLEELLKSVPVSTFLGGSKAAKKPAAKLAPGLGYEEPEGGIEIPGLGKTFHRSRRPDNAPIKFVRGSEATLPIYDNHYGPSYSGASLHPSTQHTYPAPQDPYMRPASGAMPNDPAGTSRKRTHANVNEAGTADEPYGGYGAAHGQGQTYGGLPQTGPDTATLHDYSQYGYGYNQYTSQGKYSAPAPPHSVHPQAYQGQGYSDYRGSGPGDAEQGATYVGLADQGTWFNPVTPSSAGAVHAAHAAQAVDIYQQHFPQHY